MSPMQDEEENEEPKHPIDMTSDELLDYAVHPDVAEKLKARVREEEPCDPETD